MRKYLDFVSLFFGIKIQQRSAEKAAGTLALTASGIAVLFLKGFVNKENVLNGIVGTPLFTWFYASVYWVIYYFLDSPYSYLYAMKSLPLQLLFNGIAGAALYFILLKRVIKHRRDRYFK